MTEVAFLLGVVAIIAIALECELVSASLFLTCLALLAHG